VDAETTLLEKINKNQEGGGHESFSEEESRSIQLLIENETLVKKAFAFKRKGKEALECVQNPRVDPFPPKIRAKLGF
jgi:hypothetical protein